MFGLPPFDRIDNVRKGLTSSQKVRVVGLNIVYYIKVQMDWGKSSDIGLVSLL